MTYEKKIELIKKIIDDLKYFRSTSTKWLKEYQEERINCLEDVLNDLLILGLYSNYYIMNEPENGYEGKAVIEINCEDGAFKAIQEWENEHINNQF